MAKRKNEMQADPWQKWLDKLSPQARQGQIYLSRKGRREIRPCWHLLIITDRIGELAESYRCASFEQLAAKVMSLPQSVQVQIFFGVRTFVSKPTGPAGLRYLIHPRGSLMPLFEQGSLVEPDFSGSLYPTEKPLQPPQDDEEGADEPDSQYDEVDNATEEAEEPPSGDEEPLEDDLSFPQLGR